MWCLALAVLSGGPMIAEDPLNRLELTAPISRWDEGLPLGNGLTGALLWGGENQLSVSLDRGDLWDLRQPPIFSSPEFRYATIKQWVAEGKQAEISRVFDWAYDHFPTPTKLPGARLEIGLSRAIRRFDLDLRRGEATLRGAEGAVAEALMPPGLNGIVMRCDAPVAEVRIRRPAAEPREGSNSLDAASIAALGYPTALEGSDDGEVWFVQPTAEGWSYGVVCRWTTGAHGAELVALIERGPGQAWLASARRRAAEALSHGYAAWRDENASWWQSFHQSSRLQLPDESLQRHYNTVKYFYGAASRRSAPPMPLQGVWTADAGTLPPWKGDYHNDLNTQTTYGAYLTAGLFDSGLSFLDLMWDLRPTFQDFAKDFYEVNGLIVPGVMDLKGRPLGGWSQYSLSPTNTAWIADLFVKHWQTTGDPAFLRERAYPWCADAGNALAALLQPGPDGRWVLPLSSSPEIHDSSLQAWLKPNSNYDLTLMLAMFQGLERMALALERPDEAERWAEFADRLGPLWADDVHGFLVAEGMPLHESHRHFSHLMAIHPLYLCDAPPLRDVARRSLASTLRLGTKQWTGYSFSWMACMLARIGDGEGAYRFLKDYLNFTVRNGFHVNGDQSGTGLSNFTYRPFTLEGNFLAMQAVHEMLMQTRLGVIEVFPAVPDEWTFASFSDLAAEKGVRVSARRSGGRTVSIELRASREVEARLIDPFGGHRATWSRKPATASAGELRFALKAGESVMGTAAD